MPVPPLTKMDGQADLQKLYLGIDPGVSGGIALVGCGEPEVTGMPSTDKDIWNWFADGAGVIHAIIEQQTPRPARFFDKATHQWKTTILRSTCILFGNYQKLIGMLVALGVPYEECPPKRWQKALNIPNKEKTESQGHWKNRLKAKAQQLFPEIKVTLKTADALLIAEYCRRKCEGKL